MELEKEPPRLAPSALRNAANPFRFQRSAGSIMVTLLKAPKIGFVVLKVLGGNDDNGNRCTASVSSIPSLNERAADRFSSTPDAASPVAAGHPRC